MTAADAMPARGGARSTGTPVMLALVLALAAPALGASMLVSPALPFMVIAAGFYVWLCFASPAWAFAAYACAHLAVPIYLRPPAIGPLPAPPIALVMLFTLAGCLLARQLATLPAARPWGGRGRTAVRFFLVFALIAALSLIDDRTTGEGVNMWVKAFAFPFLTLLTASASLETRRDVERTLEALLIAAVLISAYAIYEFLVGSNYLLENFLIPIGQEDWSKFYFTGEQLGPGIAYRSFSVFSQPIEFATCVGMVYPYAVIRFGAARSFAAKLMFAVAAGVCLVGLSASFSRTAIVAALLATIAAGLIVPALRKWLVAAIATVTVAALALWPVLGEKVSERVTDVDNVTLRAKLWETALRLFADHPLTGVGFGNFPEYYLETMREHLIGPVNEFGADSIERVRVAENFYLQLAAETGVVGLIAFVSFALAALWLLVKVARAADEDVRRLGLALLIGSVVYFLNAATVTAYTHFSSTMILLGLFFPLAVTLERRMARSSPETTA